MATILSLSRFTISLIMGICLATKFSGVTYRYKPLRLTVFVSVTILFLIAVQGIIYFMLGLELARILYPLHTHLPLILLFWLVLKCSALQSVFSVLVCYLTLQIPNWLSKLITYSNDEYGLAEFVKYIIFCLIVLWLVFTFFTKDILDTIYQSNTLLAAYMIVPLIYYLFDYITTVWTQILYQGLYLSSQFMPTIACATFLILLYMICKEQNKRMLAAQEKTMLEKNLLAAETEFQSLIQKQEDARIYRHDMRHHFSLLLTMAEQDMISDMKLYLRENIKNINSITPRKFTHLEMLNLILSHLAEVAEANEIKYDFDVKIDELYSLSTTELCSLVSNAIENAINAVEDLPSAKKTISMKLTDFNGNIAFSIENPYEGDIEFQNGIPQNHAEGHGYGTKSIYSITKNHGGEAVFTANDHIFKVMVLIPNKNHN